MKVVYLCHPFSGDIAVNCERVRRFCLAVKREVVPIAPHLMLPRYIDEATERDLALRHGLALLRLADEVWVLSDRVSPGMHGEIVEARKLGIPVLNMARLVLDEEVRSTEVAHVLRAERSTRRGASKGTPCT